MQENKEKVLRCRITQKMLDELECIADQELISISEFMRQAIQAKIEEHKDETRI